VSVAMLNFFDFLCKTFQKKHLFADFLKKNCFNFFTRSLCLHF
jgi:hypothetical protein